ncbi:Hypothetical protein GLP15_373 [Giardia lamblia P15]|uniref:Uncharacterized protein n=1 Tax=Giardia intestinalis (strain P15) TaxID=658858 RepID=E1EXR3_GIAIA|nr:Hypothetical protein GLP15_373 [Giardia lamblia P15]
MAINSLCFGNIDRTGLISYEAGFPLTYIDPQAPIANTENFEQYQTDLLTPQEQCILKQYNTMENLTKLQRARDLEEKRQKLNLQLSNRRTKSSFSNIAERYRRERIQTARKYEGCLLRSRASSPGETASAPEGYPIFESQPEPISECSLHSSVTGPSPARWQHVSSLNRSLYLHEDLSVSCPSPCYSPKLCSLRTYHLASLQRARMRKNNEINGSLLHTPVGQHSNNYIYVMDHLAPDIHYHSWRSKQSLSDTNNIREHALPAPSSDKLANNSALSPAIHVTQKQAKWGSPRKGLSSTSSVKLPQLGGKQRKASFGLSPMHPVTQNLPADSADMLTVKAIDQSDLKLEDLVLPN